MNDLVPNPPIVKRRMNSVYGKFAPQDLPAEFRRLALRIGLEQAEKILQDMRSKLL